MGIFDFRLLSFIGIKKKPKAPWSKYYKKTAMKIRLRNENIYDYMKRKMIKHHFENNIAINYFGTKISEGLVNEKEIMAEALAK
jgi:hypothetical protein